LGDDAWYDLITGAIGVVLDQVSDEGGDSDVGGYQSKLYEVVGFNHLLVAHEHTAGVAANDLNVGDQLVFKKLGDEHVSIFRSWHREGNDGDS